MRALIFVLPILLAWPFRFYPMKKGNPEGKPAREQQEARPHHKPVMRQMQIFSPFVVHSLVKRPS